MIAFHNPHIRVTVVDRDENRIRRWNSKHPPIHEPGLNDILRIARDGSRECVVEGAPAQCDDQDTTSEAATASSECTSQCEGHSEGLICVAAREPNLVFTTDVAKCVGEADVVLIAVNTPTKSRGNGAGSATDMAAFEAVTAVVAQHARPGAIIVEKSTVPCRTAQLVQDTVSHIIPAGGEGEKTAPDSRGSSRYTDQESISRFSATQNSSRPAQRFKTFCTRIAS